jgi:isopentenyl-diphosphate delta-isomerase
MNKLSSHTHHTDLVTLVTPEDLVIGTMDKIEAHRGQAKLHRAISVFLFRKNEVGEVELLIQQRSKKKIVGAEQWANTVCGNVWPEESYEACAQRRLQFELGITQDQHGQPIELQPVEKFQYQVECNDEFSENEMDQVFMGWFDGAVVLNRDEVMATEWVSWEKICDRVVTKDWTPWFEIMLDKNDLLLKLSTLKGKK